MHRMNLKYFRPTIILLKPELPSSKCIYLTSLHKGQSQSLKPMIHGSTSFNFCWATNVERGCDLLNANSTFVEQQLRILKMADDEMLLSLYAARVGVEKKKTENLTIWTREWLLKNKTSFINNTPSSVGHLR